MHAGFPDDQYAEAGAELTDDGRLLDGVEGLLRVGQPSADEIAAMRAGTVLIGFLQPLTDAETVERLQEQGVLAFRDGVDPADHAGAVDGCAVVAGDDRRVQGVRCSRPTGARSCSRC